MEYTLAGAQLCFGYEWRIADGARTTAVPSMHSSARISRILGPQWDEAGADANAAQGQRSRQFSLDMFVQVYVTIYHKSRLARYTRYTVPYSELGAVPQR